MYRLGLEGRVPDYSTFSKTRRVASGTVMGYIVYSSWWCSARSLLSDFFSEIHAKAVIQRVVDLDETPP